MRFGRKNLIYFGIGGGLLLLVFGAMLFQTLKRGIPGSSAPASPGLGKGEEILEGLVLDIEALDRIVTLQENGTDRVFSLVVASSTKLLDQEGGPIGLEGFARGFAVTAQGRFEGEAEFRPSAIQIVETAVLVEYSNPYFKISFGYPSTWLPDQVMSALPDVPSGFRGDGGFFAIDALGGNPSLSLHQAIEGFVSDPSRIYGGNPEVVAVRIAGQEGGFIFPSRDQSPELGSRSAFVIRYPEPVRIRDNIYYFFVIHADRAHIEALAQTLAFL